MISIIIPIYNAELYLEECINSILLQTFDNFEVLLINDGSTDTSLNICKAFENKDNRIHVYNNKNHGVCYSRNFGIHEAKGEFIAFIDSDDKYDKDFLLILYESICESNSDIAVCDFYNDNGRENPDWENSVIYGTNEIFSAYLHGMFNNRIMNKLYKKEIISNVLFPEGRSVLEDADWTSRVFLNCKSISVVSKGSYYYRNVVNSLSRRKMNENEEVASFKNIVSKYNIISNNTMQKDDIFLLDQIMKFLPWILLSNSDLQLYDTYSDIRKLVFNTRFDLYCNDLLTIIREEENSQRAQKLYYKNVIKDPNVLIKDKLKYIYRRIRKFGKFYNK